MSVTSPADLASVTSPAVPGKGGRTLRSALAPPSRPNPQPCFPTNEHCAEGSLNSSGNHPAPKCVTVGCGGVGGQDGVEQGGSPTRGSHAERCKLGERPPPSRVGRRSCPGFTTSAPAASRPQVWDGVGVGSVPWGAAAVRGRPRPLELPACPPQSQISHSDLGKLVPQCEVSLG